MAAIDISGSQESNESTDTSVISIDSPMKSNGTVIEIRSDSEQEDQRKVNVVDEICEEHEQSTGTATENQNENNVSANDVIITNMDVSGTILCSSILTTVNSLKRIKSREGRRYRSTNKPNGIFSYENEPSSSEENQSKSRRNSLRNSKRIKKHRTKIMDENDNEKKETVNENIKSIKSRLGSKNISRNSIKNGSDRNGYVDSSWENLSEVGKIKKGIRQVQNFFDQGMCRKIEKKIDQISEKAKCGLYRQKTYDRAPLRNKYFFGEGYTYGKQMDKKGPGQERLHKKGDVDDIPNWIKKHIIQKLYDENIVPEGFINSAVINEYFPGGCIVSHIDPIHIFDRPIISINFNSKSYLSFGCRFSFNPIRTTDPVHAIPLERGCLTMISGYAADNVTHCIRPQDVTERRCVIILRRVFPDAPRVDDETAIELPLRNAQWSHKPFQSLNFDDERATDNNTYNTRKRSRTKDFYEHDDRAIDEHRHNKRKRHSY